MNLYIGLPNPGPHYHCLASTGPWPGALLVDKTSLWTWKAPWRRTGQWPMTQYFPAFYLLPLLCPVSNPLPHIRCHLFFQAKESWKGSSSQSTPITLPSPPSLKPPPPGCCLAICLLIPYLDGFHWVVLVQFVNMVSYAGVERGGSDRVDDGGIVGLLLVPLAVGVDEQRKEAAQDGAAQPHGDHVEHVELWEDSITSDATLEKNTLLNSSTHSDEDRKAKRKAPDQLQTSRNHRTFLWNVMATRTPPPQEVQLILR